NFNITWKRIEQIFLTFALVILSSQAILVLQFSSNSLDYSLRLSNFERQRFQDFTALASDLNELFLGFNYTIYEQFAQYCGSGKVLEPQWYLNPEPHGFGRDEYLFGFNPVDDLRENWIELGRFVSICGDLEFRSSLIATNGTVIGMIKTYDRGPQKGQRYISLSKFMPLELYLNQLYRSAHNLQMVPEEARSLLINRNDFAQRFKASLLGALRSGQFSAWKQVESLFNRFSRRFGLIDLYSARVRESSSGKYRLIIGHEDFAKGKVHSVTGITNGKNLLFSETLELDFAEMTFSPIFSVNQEIVSEFTNSPIEDIFQFLNVSARALAKAESSFSPSRTKNYREVYPSMWNTINTEFWSEDLLAVAVVAPYSIKGDFAKRFGTDSDLPPLLDEAMKTAVYGFVDKFDIRNGKWADILLASDAKITNYNVLFIDDLVNHSSINVLLNNAQKKILGEWIHKGGSLYLSSVLAGDSHSSFVKDLIFPANWIEKVSTNIINGYDFQVLNEHWINRTDTPLAAKYTGELGRFGEFLYSNSYSGYIPSALHIGLIERKDIYGNYLDDCSLSDKQVSILQTINVPETYSKITLSIDWRKLTSEEGSSLKIRILDKMSNLVAEEIIVPKGSPTNSIWKTTTKVLTEKLRPYSGQTLTFYLIVQGTSGEFYQYQNNGFTDLIYGNYEVDNLLLSVSGGKGSIPVFIYYDQELMDKIDNITYGEWTDSSSSYSTIPYHSVDAYRAAYFANTIENQLKEGGYPYVEIVNGEELLDYLSIGEEAVIIASHPLPSNIYDGDKTNPLMEWIYNKGGIFIETQVEPLSYYFDSQEHLKRVPNADISILKKDIFQSILEYNGEYCFGLYNENFDDNAANYVVENKAEIKLENLLGGILEITDSINLTCYDQFEQPIIIRDGNDIDYTENGKKVFFHLDTFLTNSMIISLEGKDQNDEILILEIALGSNNVWYTETLTTGEHIFHMSIPFNNLLTPSDLILEVWSSLLVDIDIMKDVDFGTNEFHYFNNINQIELNPKGVGTLIDNIWVGYAGSTLETPAGWVAQKLDPFVSDYPGSLNVLQAMKQEDPTFNYYVFGRSEGVRELFLRDDLKKVMYPENDFWCEEPFVNWDFGTESISSDPNFYTTGLNSLS
ncbi:MAG: hypothetical protein DRO63_06250, partial [Candidatus Gerdarchaeota archaeon]